MIDSHIVPSPNWGLIPILFDFGKIRITSYSFFVLLGLIVGIIVYFYEAKKQKKTGENTLYILIAALVGGTIGAKLPYWIFYFPEIIKSYPNIMPLLSGRTITGGIIGGFLAVVWIKKKLGIKERRGNLFAPAIALGVAIGRIGCFLAGCCYGTITSFPWGVDFGDGALRHPTQIYESLFMLAMFVYLIIRKKYGPKPGRLFSELVIGYFTFRFFIEFIRVEPRIFLGLTFFQIISLLALILFYGKEFINWNGLIKKWKRI